MFPARTKFQSKNVLIVCASDSMRKIILLDKYYCLSVILILPWYRGTSLIRVICSSAADITSFVRTSKVVTYFCMRVCFNVIIIIVLKHGSIIGLMTMTPRVETYSHIYN